LANATKKKWDSPAERKRKKEFFGEGKKRTAPVRARRPPKRGLLPLSWKEERAPTEKGKAVLNSKSEQYRKHSL